MWTSICEREKSKVQEEFLDNYFDTLEGFIEEVILNENNESDEDEETKNYMVELYHNILMFKFNYLEPGSVEFKEIAETYTSHLLFFFNNDIDILNGCRFLIIPYSENKENKKIYQMAVFLLLNNKFDEGDFAKTVISLFFKVTLDFASIDRKTKKDLESAYNNFKKYIENNKDFDTDDITDFISEEIQPILFTITS